MCAVLFIFFLSFILDDILDVIDDDTNKLPALFWLFNTLCVSFLRGIEAVFAGLCDDDDFDLRRFKYFWLRPPSTM